MNATYSARAGASSEAPVSKSRSAIQLLLQYAGLLIVDAFAFLLVYQLANDGIWELAIFIALVTIVVNYVNIRPDLSPLRWISPAFTLMMLLVVYPLIYTVFVAFTNYGDGNLLTKAQVIDRINQVKYIPEDGQRYDFTVFRDTSGAYALWLVDSAGTAYFAKIAEPLVTVGEAVEVPETFEGFTRLSRAEFLQASAALQGVEFGPAENSIGVTSRNAATYRIRYVYDPQADIFTDQVTGTVYRANEERGGFLDENGAVLITGYRVLIGTTNFTRFLTSPAIGGPLLSIFVWTITFALLSVASTFALGLLVALLLQADTPGKKLFRTLLIVPYALPGLIAVATWRGMLNPNLGVISTTINNIFGFTPPFFADPTWARIGILVINLWLGYPYFMLVCSGALAAIPQDMYEAARVDGANAWQQFLYLTMPMLLVAVGPLLIASFTFNFNNFVIIDVYNEGGPPIPGTPTPAGHTDILISYAFRLAFGGGRGADFGLAAAITIIIFIMVATITLLQFRFTGRWEETSKNV